MRLYPLSIDGRGKPFRVPAHAALWKVYRDTGGRPVPYLDDEQQEIFVAIDATREALIEAGCKPGGRVFLEAVDGKRRPVGTTRGVAEIPHPNEAAAATAPDASTALVLGDPAHEGYTRIIEAVQRRESDADRYHTMAVGKALEALTEAVKSPAVLQASEKSTQALVEVIKILSQRHAPPPADVAQQWQQFQKVQQSMIRNAAAPTTADAGAAAAADPTLQAAQGLVGAIGPLLPLATAALAKLLNLSPEHMAMVKDLAQAQARGATASAEPAWPAELRTVLHELTPAERDEAIAFMRSSEATPLVMDKLFAQLRTFTTIREQVDYVRGLLAHMKVNGANGTHGANGAA
jgi:hypothetical protein